MADKIVVLNAGRVEQVGAPLELFDRPANLFVAGFIGSPADELHPGPLHRRRLCSRGRRAAAARRHTRNTAGPRSHLRHPSRTPGRYVAPRKASQQEVLLVEPMGSETQVTLRLGQLGGARLFRERIAVEPGVTVHVRPKADAIHLFGVGGDSGL